MERNLDHNLKNSSSKVNITQRSTINSVNSYNNSRLTLTDEKAQRTFFEMNKEELINKILSLISDLDKKSSLLNDNKKIYDNTIKEIQTKFKNDYENLEKSFNSKISQIINQKNQQINILSDKNECLTNQKEELTSKVNELLSQINDQKVTFEEKYSNMEYNFLKAKNEKERLISYYENKIDYYKNTKVQETQTVTNNYDNLLNQMKDNYKNAKANLSEVLSQREEEIKNYKGILERERNEVLIQKEKISNEHKNLKDSYEKMKNLAGEQKILISTLTEENHKLKRNLTEVNKEKEDFENKCDILVRENHALLSTNQRLSQIATGNFSYKKERKMKY